MKCKKPKEGYSKRHVELRVKSLATVNQIPTECDKAAARHHKLLFAILYNIRSREERKCKAADCIIKLRTSYVEIREVMVEAHVAECSSLRDRISLLRSWRART